MVSLDVVDGQECQESESVEASPMSMCVFRHSGLKSEPKLREGEGGGARRGEGPKTDQPATRRHVGRRGEKVGRVQVGVQPRASRT